GVPGMPRRHPVPLRPAQLPALGGGRRAEQAARGRPDHPRPAGRLQPPDRGTGRRGYVAGVRGQPDQPRVRELRGQARRAWRARRAPITAGRPSRSGRPSDTLHRVPSLFRRKSAGLVEDAVTETTTETTPDDAKVRRPRGYTPGKGKATPKRPRAGAAR